MFLIRFVSGHNLCSHLLDVSLWQMSTAPRVDCQKVSIQEFSFYLETFLIDITLHISKCTINAGDTTISNGIMIFNIHNFQFKYRSVSHYQSNVHKT